MNKRLKKKMAKKSSLKLNGSGERYVLVTGSGGRGITHFFEIGSIVKVQDMVIGKVSVSPFIECIREEDGLVQRVSPFHLQLGDA